jgi:hypothetical protein
MILMANDDGAILDSTGSSKESAHWPVGDASVDQPSLSVLLLLIWVGLVASFIGLWDLLDRLQPESVQHQIGDWTKRPISVMLRTMAATASGAAVGGALLFVAYRRRGLAFPVQPGEWLLVTLGVADLVNLGFWYSSLLTKGGTYYIYDAFVYLYLTEHIEYAFAFGIAALCCKTAGPWRWFLWSATIAALLSAGRAALPLVDEWQSIYTHQLIRWPTMAICSIMLAIAVASDRWHRTERGWIHWVGVFTLVLTFVEEEIWYDYVRFFRY